MRTFLTALLATGATLLAPSPVRAANDCANASTQAALNACASQSLRESDAELNRLYARIQLRLQDDAKARERLRTAQRAWLAWRDAECSFSTSASAGGSAHGMAVTGCRDSLTRNRVKDLTGYLQCQEGDVSCAVPAK